KQKIFQDKICYYANCSAEIDFGDFLKSDKVPIGFSIIRDDSSWMYWRILKENSKNIYGTAQDGNGKSYHLEVFNGLYNGYKSIMNDFTGRTITATDADGKTVKLKVTGIS